MHMRAHTRMSGHAHVTKVHARVHTQFHVSMHRLQARPHASSGVQYFGLFKPYAKTELARVRTYARLLVQQGALASLTVPPLIDKQAAWSLEWSC